MIHQCSICLKRFQFASKLQRHHLTHTGHRPFTCPICGKAFRQTAHLKTHQEIHAKQGPLTHEMQLANESTSITLLSQGTQDGSALLAGSTLQSHEQKDSTEAAEPVTAVTVKQSELCWIPATDWKPSDWTPQNHVLQEQQCNSTDPTDCKAHQCDICLKWFASVLQLHKHSFIHRRQKSAEAVKRKAKLWSDAGDLPLDSMDSGPAFEREFPLNCPKSQIKHQCPECPKSFSSPSKLRRHCLIHTGQRPFACLECGGTFRQLAHLKTHQQTHRKAWRSSNHSGEQMGECSQNLEALADGLSQPEVTDCKSTFNISAQPEKQNQINSDILCSNECTLTVPQTRALLLKNQGSEEDHATLTLTTDIKTETGPARGPAKVDVKDSKCSLTDVTMGPIQGRKYSLNFSQYNDPRKHKNEHRNEDEPQGENEGENAENLLLASSDSLAEEEMVNGPDHNQTATSPDDVAALAMQLELNIMVKSENLDIHPDVPMAEPEGPVVAKQRGPRACAEKVKKSHQCTMCLRRFPAPSKLRRHILVHTGQRPFSCHVCGKRFRQLTHVKLHVRTHTSPRRVQLKKVSTNCGSLSFSQGKGDRAASFTTPTQNAPLEKHVSAKFRSESHLEMSAAEKVPMESDLVRDGVLQSIVDKSHRRHQCLLCSKFFPSPYKLKRHILIHTGQKPFQCICCGKTFRQAVHLKVHQQTHCRLRLFKGALQQKFLNLIRSATRGRSHGRHVISQEEDSLAILPSHAELTQTPRRSGEPIMDNGTSAGKKINEEKFKSSFVSLKSTHGKTRAYECPFCLKCFSAPSKLARHNLIHTGQRPFQCPICHRAFRQSSHLKAHHSVHVRRRPIHQRQAVRWGGNRVNETLGNNAVAETSITDCEIPDLLNPTLGTQAEEATTENKLHELLDSEGRSIPKWSYHYSCERRLDSPYKFQRPYLTHQGHGPFNSLCSRKFRLSAHLRRHQRTHFKPPSPILPAESRRSSKPHALPCLDYSQQGAPTDFTLPEYSLPYEGNLQTQNTQFCKQSFTKEECEYNRVGLAVPDHGLADGATAEDIPAEALPPVTQCVPSRRGHSVGEAAGEFWVASPYPGSSTSDHVPTHGPLSLDPSDVSMVKTKRTREYQCSVCQKNFDSPSKLSRHFLIHTGLKPFRCSFCGKAFRQLCHLRTHQQIHKGARRSSPPLGVGNVQDHLVSGLPDSGSVGEMNLPGSVGPLEEKGDHTWFPCHTSQPQEQDHCFSLGGQKEKSLVLTGQVCEVNGIDLDAHDYETVNGVMLDGGPVGMELSVMQYPAEKPRECIQSISDKWGQQNSMSEPSFFSTTYMVQGSEITSIDMASVEGKTNLTQHSDLSVQSCEQGSDNCSAMDSPNLAGDLNTTSAGMAIELGHTVDENFIQRKTRHECPECQRSFSSPSKLKRHYLIHAGEKPFRCTICGKDFRQAVHLKFHQRVHTHGPAHSGIFQPETAGPKAEGEGIWQPYAAEPGSSALPECAAQEDLPEEAQEVSEGWCEPLSETFCCEKCDLTFFTETELQLHQCAHRSSTSTRSSSETRSCEKCDSTFFTETELQLHECAHRSSTSTRSSRSYQCAVCFKNFEAPSKLKRHYVIHTGQRPFQCSLCGKTFTQSGHLKTHQLVHK
ncbi:uncharacterized protein znf770 [Paramormyrops kingsleyae]|uniref:uncharacterized protein znf770 n=1 Tax=Paramormyrops kingsleyae TaxID=1676925 RepID=UPI003B970421